MSNRDIGPGSLDVTGATNEQLDAVNGRKAVTCSPADRCVGERRECVVRQHHSSYSAGVQ